MIKNDIQLRIAEKRLQDIQEQIDEYQQLYSGVELEIYITPLVDERNIIDQDIEEYSFLKLSSLEEAIKGRLRKPVLLDNISELLTKLRIAANLTQEELAGKLGWQQSNLSRFESEAYGSQNIGKIIEYVSSLNVWLHVTPSLFEKPPDMIEVKRISYVQVSKYASTDSEVFGHKIEKDTNSEDYYEDINPEYEPRHNLEIVAA